MIVMYWVKYGYRKKTRAYIVAKSIISQTDSKIRILIDDNETIDIKRNDLISIEEESNGGKENV